MMEDRILASLRAAHGCPTKSKFSNFSLDNELFRARQKMTQKIGVGVSEPDAKMSSFSASATSTGATTAGAAVHNLLVDMDDQDSSNDVLKRLICEVAEAVVNDEDESNCSSPVQVPPKSPLPVKASQRSKLGPATAPETTMIGLQSQTDCADNDVMFMKYLSKHKHTNNVNSDSNNNDNNYSDNNNSYNNTFVSSTMTPLNRAHIPFYPLCNTTTPTAAGGGGGGGGISSSINANSVTNTNININSSSIASNTISNVSAVNAGSFVVEGITSSSPAITGTPAFVPVVGGGAAATTAITTATPVMLPPPPPPPPMYSAPARSPFMIYRPLAVTATTPHSGVAAVVNISSSNSNSNNSRNIVTNTNLSHNAPPPSFDEAVSLSGTLGGLQGPLLPPSHEVSPTMGSRYMSSVTATAPSAVPLDTILLRNDNGVFLLQSISSAKMGPRVYSPQSNYVRSSSTYNYNSHISTSNNNVYSNNAANSNVNTPPLSPLPRYTLPPSSANAAAVGRSSGYSNVPARKKNNNNSNSDKNVLSVPAETGTVKGSKGATFLTSALLENDGFGQTQRQQAQQQRLEPPPQYCDVACTSPAGMTVTSFSTPAITPSAVTTPVVVAAANRACGRNVACNTYGPRGSPTYTQSSLSVRGGTLPYASAPPPYCAIKFE